jgi:hypothetical protein
VGYNANLDIKGETLENVELITDKNRELGG